MSLKPIYLYCCIVLGSVFQVLPVGTTATVPFFRIMYTEPRAATSEYPERHKGEVKYFYRLELKGWIQWFSMYWIIFFLSALPLTHKHIEHENIYKTFMGLQLFNIIDFCVTFNTGWFMVSDFVVTYRMFMALILAGSIVYEYGRIID